MESAFERIYRIHQNDPVKQYRMQRFNKHKMKSHDIRSRACVRCNRPEAHIRVHGLNYCRQCFREIAKDLGFRKYGAEV